MIKQISFVFVTLVITSLCCCGPSAELVPTYVEKSPIKIIGGYSLGKPWLGGLELYGATYPCEDDLKAKCYPTTIEEAVVHIGWNDKFILGECHPRKEVILSTPDSSNRSWFIINLTSGEVYKDLSRSEFLNLIDTLTIPDIELKDALSLYKQ